MSSGHKKEHRGYYRIAEAAERRIEESFDQPHVRRAAKLTYHTLCRVANLRGASKFVADLNSLARDIGYSYREAQKAVRILESIGLLKITNRYVSDTKLKAPSCYEVVTLIPDNSSIGSENLSTSGSKVAPIAPQHSQELPIKTPPKDSMSGEKKISVWEAKTKKEAAEQALARLYNDSRNKRRKEDSFEMELTPEAKAKANSLRQTVQKMEALLLTS
jgi:hypothetical protein